MIAANPHLLSDSVALLMARVCIESEVPARGLGYCFTVRPCWRERQDGQNYVTRVNGERVVADPTQAANGGGR